MNNPFRLVTKQDLKDFYNKIKPYLGYEEMEDSDMDDVVTPLPSVGARYHKYSTEEQVVGEWIDGKPIYQVVVHLSTRVSFYFNAAWQTLCASPSNNIDRLLDVKVCSIGDNDAYKSMVVSLNNVTYDKTNQVIKAWDEASKNTTDYIFINDVILQYTKTTD